jgi:hypothetical protein
MKNPALTFCLLIISGISLYSQEETANPPGDWSRFIHIEGGFSYPSGTIKESIAIRQNLSSYFVNQSSNGEISSETSEFAYGIRWEFFNNKYKSGVSSGLRYTRFNTDISGYSSSNADFFYLRYSELNSDTKFARVKSLSEVNNFISIPLEIRAVPVQIKGLGLFAKAGAEFSLFNIKKSTHITFQDDGMNAQENVILDKIGLSTNKFCSTLYASVGLKLGKVNKPNYMFEIFLPSVFLTKNNFSLTNVDYFDGFKFSVQFPVN